jgi:replicative superfamily II helicase
MQDMFEIEETSQEAAEGVNGVDARLIWDLVSNMRPAAEILKNYGLSPGDLAVKAQNELFTSAYREAQRLWKSDMNIQQRIRLKAAFLLEDSLPRLFQIVTSDNPVNAKLNAIEQLQKIAIVQNENKKGDSMEKHNIIINIGPAQPINIVAEVPHGKPTFSERD